MEKLIKNLLDEGFSIALYNDIEHENSYFVDMKKGFNRACFSISKDKTEQFPNYIEIIIEQLSKTINSNGKQTISIIRGK